MPEKSDKRKVALSGAIRPLKPVYTWTDLTLSPDQSRVLQEIISAQSSAPSQTTGLRALFTGPDSPGNTMAAEVTANELHLDLYRIDLSAVVSKYIGETEKNLRRLFDTAEASDAILLFDEADALFGKRDDAQDSHDHPAKGRLNDLRQRIETYRGLTILAAKSRMDLDPASIRRMRYIIAFPSDIREK